MRLNSDKDAFVPYVYSNKIVSISKNNYLKENIDTTRRLWYDFAVFTYFCYTLELQYEVSI